MATARLPKFDPPRLARVVERPRISSLLDEISSRAAVWIAAHGGSGKSTAVATWVARRKKSRVWMHLDSGDTHVATFLEYFEAALKAALPRRQFKLPVYSKEAEADVPNFARRFLRAMFAAFPDPPPAIVFDNVHDLPESSPVHLLLATLCEECPAGVALLFLSRTQPPAPYLKLATYGRIEVLGGEVLNFTREELASALIARGIALDARLAELHEMSGGWIAGAVLLSMREGNPGGAIGLPAGDSDALFDFFAGETFDHLDGGDRNLLVRTAFLRDITPAAARALSGDDRAVERLDRLARRNLFTEKRGTVEPRYRYHDLFRAFLQRSASQALGADNLRQLKLDTAAQLAGADEAHDSISLLVECHAWNEARRAILRHVEGMLATGRYETVVGWLHGLPAVELDRDPWLLFWLGQCLLYADDSQARSWLEKAYDAFVGRDDAVGRFVCAVSIPVAMNTGHGTFDGLPEWIARIEAEKRVDAFPSPFLELKSVGAQLYLAQLSDRFGALVPHLCTRVLALAPQVQDPNLQLQSLGQVVHLGWRMRQSDHVPEAILQVERLGLLDRASPLVVLRWLNDYVTYECAHGSIEAGRTAADLGIRLAADSRLPHAMFDAVLIRTEPAGDVADIAEYEQFARELARHVDPSWPFSRAANHAIRGRLALLRSDGNQALEQITQANAVLDEMGRPMTNREAFFMVEASAHALRNDFDAAIALCHRYRKVARAGQVATCDVFAECYHALASLRAARPDARDRLARAIGGAREQGLNIVLRHATSLLVELCAAALREGIEVEFVRALVRRRRLPPPAVECPEWPWPLRIRCLGRFEVVRDGEPVANLGKQQKTLQLLQMLIALGGRDVGLDRLIEPLWPGEGRVGQQQAFDTTLHRLRKLLGSETALMVAERQLSLNDREVWVDAMSLARRLDEIEAAGPMVPGPREFSQVAEIVALYRGHFLATAGDEPWALAARERLWDRMRRLLLAFAGAADRAGESEQALRIYHFIADLDPLAEDAFLELMRHFAQRGHKAEALRAYERCAAALATELGSTPGSALQALATKLRGQP